MKGHQVDLTSKWVAAFNGKTQVYLVYEVHLW
jgi:hypothetical protein